MPERASVDPRCAGWPERPGVPRYSRRPLPPYRFIPKLAPHPTADPAGHSYDRAVEPAGGEDDFRYGVDLYNRGYWWEAHEAWEAVWLRAGDRDSPRRLAIQGLIQIANAHLKLELNRRNAVIRLREKYAELFDRAGRQGRAMGFDLAAFVADVDAYLDAALAAQHLRHDIAAFPVILLDDA